MITSYKPTGNKTVKLWYLYILDLEQEVSRQSSYIDLHSRFVLHLPECDYIIKELHPLRNTEWPLFVPDVIIALACCRKPPVWRHTHVTVVHVTKACGSGLSERSHVFTRISTWVTCADLRGRGGGYWTIRLISQFIYMLRTVYLSGKEHYYYSCQKIPAILKKKWKYGTSIIKPSSPLIFLCKLWGIKRPIGVDLDRWGIKTLLDSLLHVLNALDLHPCTKKIDREWNTRINIFYQTFCFTNRSYMYLWWFLNI